MTFNLETATAAVQSGDKEQALKASIWAIGHYEKAIVKANDEAAEAMTLFSVHTLEVCRKFAEHQKGFVKDKTSKLTAPEQKFERDMAFWGFTKPEQVSEKFFTHAKKIADKENAPLIEATLKNSTRGYSTLASLYSTIMKAKSKANGAKNANANKRKPAEKLADLIRTAFAYGNKNGMTDETILAAINEQYGKAKAKTEKPAKEKAAA
jgi:hypothetical protein